MVRVADFGNQCYLQSYLLELDKTVDRLVETHSFYVMALDLVVSVILPFYNEGRGVVLLHILCCVSDFFVFDFQDHIPEPVSARPVPKLRPKSAAKAPIRPRPKTIHVDQGADVSASLAASRGQRGSSSNLSGKNFTDSFNTFVYHTKLNNKHFCMITIFLCFKSLLSF